MPLRSTSVVAQYHAVREGRGLAVLPCFMATQSPDLVPVLVDEIDLVRTFWIAAQAIGANWHACAPCGNLCARRCSATSLC